MSEPTVIGLKPWLPWPLKRWPWWTEPVRAERLAALRIGVAAVLLLDIFGAYHPQAHDLFDPDRLGNSEAWARITAWLPASLDGVQLVSLALDAWALFSGMLMLGCCSRLSSLMAWLLSQLFFNLNPLIHNGGDTVRTIILFYLVLSPCGAVWSVDAWFRRDRRSEGPTFVFPWALRLLFIQMVMIYFLNGVHKLRGVEWQLGTSLHYVLADLTFARWPYSQLPAPFWVTRMLTWTVLAWEIGFPLLVFLPSTRIIALFMGAAFHIGIGLSLELGVFSFYMLCLYLPLIPWEYWVGRFRRRASWSD